MDLRQMEVVVAVAEEGRFTAAARRLHVVQSAVSGTVRALEKELGTQLFDRTTHRVSLTAAGEAFVPAARAALRAADQARAAVDLVRGELRGQVTVGTMQGVWAGLHHALAALRAEHPGVVVRLRQAAVADIREALRDGSVDLAVVAFDRQQQRGLETRLLAREEMVVAASLSRAFAQDDRVTFAEIARMPFVDFTPGWAIRSAVDRVFRAAAVERSVAFEVNDIVAASELVRHDLGVCVMPESIAGRFPDLVLRRFARNPPRWNVLVARPGGEAPPAVAALLRHIT
ncbi:LysR family transcriptional regulator [Streptomyces cocklensis]|jgi:DNA-binding transcriptional LysR family regulator|uniref:LysR family transcriptional regulator n=1 Tax=Actinacidiphila cocklensis TaxID=887465 RepID=A0A9W4GUS4_9ACTN|nr:LysR family transcriptional regulator [Actinacidiphila cocklensis]MDD1059879.1 LysR family transcriptional regulator [Actinacidiphila cocklensis]WSX72746.1 LysR family transcriptional regulator [Streptomyces sp. NBC_00899]WSX81186.1 LysR family transcriptional regulator [Streptomyces sp. NBC_00899]CAG6397180.1 LysR family transcriptional regulator [Actinacidiphila cocklensis]